MSIDASLVSDKRTKLGDFFRKKEPRLETTGASIRP